MSVTTTPHSNTLVKVLGKVKVVLLKKWGGGRGQILWKNQNPIRCLIKFSSSATEKSVFWSYVQFLYWTNSAYSKESKFDFEVQIEVWSRIWINFQSQHFQKIVSILFFLDQVKSAPLTGKVKFGIPLGVKSEMCLNSWIKLYEKKKLRYFVRFFSQVNLLIWRI